MKIAVVTSEFNQMITEPMLEQCLKGFSEQGIEPIVVKVPGAAEIPIMVQQLIQTQKPDAVVTLGCIIEGETDHYRAICDLCTHGIKDLMLKHQVPIVFEVLMTKTYQDAQERIEKGYHASYVATKMVELLKQNGV